MKGMLRTGILEKLLKRLKPDTTGVDTANAGSKITSPLGDSDGPSSASANPPTYSSQSRPVTLSSIHDDGVSQLTQGGQPHGGNSLEASIVMAYYYGPPPQLQDQNGLSYDLVNDIIVALYTALPRPLSVSVIQEVLEYLNPRSIDADPAVLQGVALDAQPFIKTVMPFMKDSLEVNPVELMYRMYYYCGVASVTSPAKVQEDATVDRARSNQLSLADVWRNVMVLNQAIVEHPVPQPGSGGPRPGKGYQLTIGDNPCLGTNGNVTVLCFEPQFHEVFLLNLLTTRRLPSATTILYECGAASQSHEIQLSQPMNRVISW